jgi:hypothetical protein
LEWKGWQAYRRGLATNLKRLGVQDTVIEAILRHENLARTQRFYIKTVREDVTTATKQFEEKFEAMRARAADMQQVPLN